MGSRLVIHKKAGLPRVTLEDPMAIRATFPGFNNTLSDVSHLDIIIHNMCLSLH